MKKIIALSLSVVILSSSGLFAYAGNTLESASSISENEYVFEATSALTHEEIQEILESNPATVTINEYDAILNHKSTAQMTLASPESSSLAKEVAKKVISFDPREQVYSMATKSDQELLAMGIDEARIKIIRNFSGTDAELRALSAECEVLGTPKYTKNSSGCWAKMTIFFSWDKAPIWQKRDAVVSQASTGFLSVKVADTKANINYLGPSGGTHTVQLDSDDMKKAPFTSNSTSGFHFPIIGTYSTGLITERCYAQSGTATLVFRSTSTNQVELSYGYAHANKDISASIGISFDLKGFDLNPNLALSETHYELLTNPDDSGVCDSYFY